MWNLPCIPCNQVRLLSRAKGQDNDIYPAMTGFRCHQKSARENNKYLGFDLRINDVECQQNIIDDKEDNKLQV